MSFSPGCRRGFFIILVIILFLDAPQAIVVVNTMLLLSEASVVIVVHQDLQACTVGFKWRMTRILGREGADPRISGLFFKVVVQAVLLFGS